MSKVNFSILLALVILPIRFGRGLSGPDFWAIKPRRHITQLFVSQIFNKNILWTKLNSHQLLVKTFKYVSKGDSDIPACSFRGLSQVKGSLRTTVHGDCRRHLAG